MKVAPSPRPTCPLVPSRQGMLSATMLKDLKREKPWARLRMSRKEYETRHPWKNSRESREQFEKYIVNFPDGAINAWQESRLNGST